MLISSKMNQALNGQITNEFYAAHAYLGMSCAFDAMGLKILSEWFQKHSAEERTHAMKILKFVQDVGGHVQLEAIAKPNDDCSSVEKIVQAALDHELEVTKMINDLVALSEKEKDYATRSFLQWFVDEQVEEVREVTDLQQLVKRAGEKNLLQVEARVARLLESSS